MRKPSKYFSKTFLEQVIPSYLETFDNDRTANEYFSEACRISEYLEKDFLDITELDAQHYYEYLFSLYHEGKITRKTINLRFSTCKRLASFIHECNVVSDYKNPFYRIKKIPVDDDVSSTRVVPWRDLDKIMTTAEEDSMMYLILALAGRCAFTLTEIVKLKKSMISIDGDKVYVSFSRKDDYYAPCIRALPADVSTLMIDYLNSAIIYSEYGYIFYNQHKNPITARNIDKAVEKLVKKSGVEKRYTIKDFRTRCIVDMKLVGVTDEDIADYINVGERQVGAYATAAYFAKQCPADLVNYSLKKGDKKS